MYYVENSHEAIIDKGTFELVQQELRQRAEKVDIPKLRPAPYPFTSLLCCGLCGKRFRRKIASAGSKYEKPVWICPTFNTYGKSVCPAQQIPETILIAITSEVLGTADWDRDTLLEQITEIRVPEHNRLVYVFCDGRTRDVVWQNPSRRESWTEEMKQKAREDATKPEKRRQKDDGTH